MSQLVEQYMYFVRIEQTFCNKTGDPKFNTVASMDIGVQEPSHEAAQHQRSLSVFARDEVRILGHDVLFEHLWNRVRTLGEFSREKC